MTISTSNIAWVEQLAAALVTRTQVGTACSAGLSNAFIPAGVIEVRYEPVHGHLFVAQGSVCMALSGSSVTQHAMWQKPPSFSCLFIGSSWLREVNKSSLVLQLSQADLLSRRHWANPTSTFQKGLPWHSTACNSAESSLFRLPCKTLPSMNVTT